MPRAVNLLLKVYLAFLPFIVSAATLEDYTARGYTLELGLAVSAIKIVGIFLPLFVASSYGNLLAFLLLLRTSRLGYISCMCILIYISWLWGLYRSLQNGIDPASAFSNFNYLALFGTYNFIVFAIKIEKVQYYIGGLCWSFGYAFVVSIVTIVVGILSVSGLDFSYFVGDFYTPLWYCSWPTFIYFLLFFREKHVIKKYIRLVFFATFMLAFVGYIGSVTYAIIFFLFALYLQAYYLQPRYRSIVFIVSLITALAFLASEISFYDILTDIVNVERDPRMQQFSVLFSEFNSIGNGLGSGFRSIDARGGVEYGMELMYVNIVHKLGFFSIPLFLLYLRSAIGSVRPLIVCLFKNINTVNPQCILAASFILPFMISGLFNPSGSSQIAALYISIGLVILKSPLPLSI